MPTGWGFDPYSMRQPKANAVCVDAMVAAGAIPIGNEAARQDEPEGDPAEVTDDTAEGADK